MRFHVLAVVFAACGGGGTQAPVDAPTPPAIDAPASGIDCSVAPTAPPAALGLDPFYVKYVDAGIPVIGSANVRDAAFAPACEIVAHMLAMRPDIRGKLVENRIRVGIMAEAEVTTDMPEHSDLDDAFPGTDWDTRARGLGATLARPLTSCGEENLLALAGDRYRGESILTHRGRHVREHLRRHQRPGVLGRGRAGLVQHQPRGVAARRDPQLDRHARGAASCRRRAGPARE